jgi:hypothetical protein
VLQNGVSMLITPGVKATLQMELGELEVLEEASEHAH